ncbi:MAG: maleylpyruvate isomerase N-terminal domain-containing protein [Bacteroidota bacterium]
MQHTVPIFLRDHIEALDAQLIECLESLSPEDWHRQSIAPKWTVKDIAAHLLDGNLRTLSMLRDGHFGESPKDPDSYQGMVAFLNRLNADWVKAMRRLSPSVMIELLKISGPAYCSYLQSLDPFAKAAFSVDWAGENGSLNWFHIAREYTEKWHHQQQIRLAVGQDAILYEDHWYQPYLDTSIRALPHHFRTITGKEGDLIQLSFIGETEKTWYLLFTKNKWELGTDVVENAHTLVQIPDSIAWRVFTKGIRREEAIARSQIHGNETLGKHIFSLIAVMA